MFFDSDMVRIDLSNFMGDSIIFNDYILKYNPNLKYINLKNYKGQDIFDNLETDKEIIICENNNTNYELNLLSLKQKNPINNCSDLCFDEFSKVKEDLNGCEIDCSKINDEANIYYDLRKKNGEPKIFPESTNIENTILSDSTFESIMIPETTNVKSTELSESTINDSTMLTDSSKIKSTELSKTTNIPSSISKEITNIPPIIPNENVNIELSQIPETTIIESPILNNSTNSNSNKLKIFLFGYDNYYI